MKEKIAPLVGIIMGSDSDWPTMEAAYKVCLEFKVPCEVRVVSAHRTPDDMARYAKSAHKRGLRVIIAGAGGAAHLPGMVASHTPLPVIGVPVESKSLKGLDSLLVHRANARRHSGGDGRNRRCAQCRVARNFDTRSWRYQAQREGDSFQEGIIASIEPNGTEMCRRI